MAAGSASSNILHCECVCAAQFKPSLINESKKEKSGILFLFYFFMFKHLWKTMKMTSGKEKFPYSPGNAFSYGPCVLVWSRPDSLCANCGARHLCDRRDQCGSLRVCLSVHSSTTVPAATLRWTHKCILHIQCTRANHDVLSTGSGVWWGHIPPHSCAT